MKTDAKLGLIGSPKMRAEDLQPTVASNLTNQTDSRGQAVQAASADVRGTLCLRNSVDIYFRLE